MRLKLTMRIEYTPSKAAWLMPLDETRLAAAVRADCDPFKLPHPPAANIRKSTNEGIEFFWSTFDESKLFQDVIRMFDVDHLPGMRVFSLKETAYIDILKRERSIVHLTLEESFELGRPPPPPPRPRLPSLTQLPKLLEDDTKLAKQKTKTKRQPGPWPFLPAVNDWHVPRRRPLARYNGSPRSYFKSEEQDRSISLYGSRQRSRSRSPKYRSRSCSPKYRRRTSRPYSPDNRRSRSPDHRRKDSRSRSRSRSPGYSDSHKRGRFKPQYSRDRSSRCAFSPSPPRKSETSRIRSEPEYHDSELPPPPSKTASDPKTKSSLANTGTGIINVDISTPSIVARLTREYAATRRDIANAAARGRLLEGQLALLSGGAPVADASPQVACVALALRARIASEQLKLQGAEKVLGDVLRECARPVVVPGLLGLLRAWEVEDQDAGVVCDV
ncbi:hypothetical protein C8F04DRAFT_1081272, partial [Mycena alexandri]